MSLGLDEARSGPGLCEKHIVMSGFQLANTSNLQVIRVPVNPHPPVVVGSLRGASGSLPVARAGSRNTSVLCNLGADFAGSNSGLDYAPGGFDPIHQKLVVSTTRVSDGRGCWLAVDIGTCVAACIPQLQYVEGSDAESSDDAQRDRKLLDTFAFYESAGLFVGMGRYLFSNGSVGLVPGVLDAESGSMSIPLSTASGFAAWDSSWEGTIAVDSAADRMYWLGYTNEAMGNELVFSSAAAVVTAAAGSGTDTAAVPSHSVGKLCGTHTDDMVAVGCPFALAIGRDSYWSGAAN